MFFEIRVCLHFWEASPLLCCLSHASMAYIKYCKFKKPAIVFLHRMKHLLRVFLNDFKTSRNVKLSVCNCLFLVLKRDNI